MLILVGSKNPVKIDSTKDAFQKFFNNVEAKGISVPSGVSDQPINDDTFIGAENRARELMKINNSEKLNADYFIGIEGGIINLYNKWFGFGAMCIIDKFENVSFGNSSHFPLPQIMVQQMLAGKELGHIMDENSGQTNTKQNQGAIGIFTNGEISRRDLYVNGIISALIPFINQELFELKI